LRGRGGFIGRGAAFRYRGGRFGRGQRLRQPGAEFFALGGVLIRLCLSTSARLAPVLVVPAVLELWARAAGL
jgi:hypothetical protein